MSRPPTQLPTSPIPTFVAIELTAAHEPLLQRFFEGNPEYSLLVNGEPPLPNEAHEEIHGEIPTGWSFTRKWLIGYLDGDGRLAAIANVVSDLLAANVWHLGLFIVATARHGTGDAQALYRGLENWAMVNGARWMRLGVVQGNARAERFWQTQGYLQTRTWDGVIMGKMTNTLCTMVKPLTGETLETYLSLVPRDRPVVRAEDQDFE
jgi:GNAT superfamily N-acetyltransferase